MPVCFLLESGRVNNQFFVNLVRPKKDLADLRITGGSFDSDSDQNLGVEGAISFPVGILQRGLPNPTILKSMQARKTIWA